MSVLFVDHGAEPNKYWSHLWVNPTWQNWTPALDIEIATSAVERGGVSIALIVFHAANTAQWNAACRSVHTALDKSLMPPFLLKVAENTDRRMCDCGWTCTSQQALLNHRNLMPHRTRFQALVRQLKALRSARPTSVQLAEAWDIWNAPTKLGGNANNPAVASLKLPDVLRGFSISMDGWNIEAARNGAGNLSPEWWWSEQGVTAADARAAYTAMAELLAQKQRLLAQQMTPELQQTAQACAAIQQFLEEAANGALTQSTVTAAQAAIKAHRDELAAL